MPHFTLEQFAAKLARIDDGYHQLIHHDDRWGVTVERIHSPAGAATIKLVGRQLGGNDYISFNFYSLTNDRILLKPCEMPEEKVISFVRDLVID